MNTKQQKISVFSCLYITISKR